MNGTTVELRPWSRARWWTLIALVFAAHLGLIFAFGDRKPVTPLPPARAPILRVASDSSEWLALNDPTLFALPHRSGFAGDVWQREPEATSRPFRWTESPRLLELPVEKLGDTFAQFARTNVSPVFELEINPEPQAVVPAMATAAIPLPGHSTLKLADGLANRHLLNPLSLPSWPAADLLTNNVAQVLVGADGRVISAKLVFTPPGSGSPEADRWALKAARTARFEPLRGADGSPTLGMMIFKWHTVPLAQSNSPASTP